MDNLIRPGGLFYIKVHEVFTVHPIKRVTP